MMTSVMYVSERYATLIDHTNLCLASTYMLWRAELTFNRNCGYPYSWNCGHHSNSIHVQLSPITDIHYLNCGNGVMNEVGICQVFMREMLSKVALFTERNIVQIAYSLRKFKLDSTCLYIFFLNELIQGY
jgi:uncharacterized membrane protein